MNALITGSTKGMGRAIALKLAEKGYNLAICSRNIEDLKELKDLILDKYGIIKVFIKVVDCSKKDEVQAFAESAISEFKFIDVLVNNVGYFKPSFILDEEGDSLLNHMNINVYAAYYLYKRLGLLMRENKKGHIFNICSVASIESIVNAGSYCVTKAALLSLNNIMRQEMMNHDVKVTAILPGSTLTDSWKGTSISVDEFIQAEDVAKTVTDILSMSKGANVEQVIIKPMHGQV